MELQDAELESGLMRFVAEGLGVTLAREQIKNIRHPGVVFRPIAPPVKGDYWIAWNRDHASRALRDYVQIVKTIAETTGERVLQLTRQSERVGCKSIAVAAHEGSV